MVDNRQSGYEVDKINTYRNSWEYVSMNIHVITKIVNILT